MRDRSSSVKPSSSVEVPEDRTNVLFDVWLTSRAVTGLLDAALASTGLTADEFGIYSVLTTTDAMTPSELARWMSAPATTVSSSIKRLEQRGHLERHRNPDDGRSIRLGLTPAGRTVHAAATQAFIPVLEQVVERLGSRERTVRRALQTLHAVVDAVGASGDR